MVIFLEKWDGNVFFSKAPLPSMVFQWFYHTWTITIECFFYRSTIDIDGFPMVFPNSGAMVSDGFDLERDLKMRVIVSASIFNSSDQQVLS